MSWLSRSLVAAAAATTVVGIGWYAVGAGPAQATRAQPPPTAAVAAATSVDRERLMHDVAALSSKAFEGRSTGTAGGNLARAWIADRFREAGLAPAGTDGYEQTFTFSTGNVNATPPTGQTVRTAGTGTNLVGRIGSDEARIIVVTAHYDHLGIRDGVIYPGADDNASGVAVLLAAARDFRRSPPRHTVVFAALDAEEQGLRGAEALVSSLPRGRLALNVNLDMVSRSSRNEIYAAGAYHSPWQTPILADVRSRAAIQVLFGHDRPGDDLEDWTNSSDHGAFHKAGVPFVYFGVEDHPDYHKPTDTADRIDMRFFGAAADMILDAIRTFDARLP